VHHNVCLNLIETLQRLKLEDVPVLPYLVYGNSIPQSVRIPAAKMQLRMSHEQLQHHIEQFIVSANVNDDQASILRSISPWFATTTPVVTSHDCPITLVHGSYGSGKSHLMVLLIKLLNGIIESAGDPSARILVTAHTNVAGNRSCTDSIANVSHAWQWIEFWEDCLSKIFHLLE